MRMLTLAIVPLLAALSIATRQPASQAVAAPIQASSTLSTSPADRYQGVARLAADTETRWVTFDPANSSTIR